MIAAKIEVAGTAYHLVLNGTALFEIEDKFGGTAGLFDAMAGKEKKSYDTMLDAFCVLAEQGELARRAFGYDKGTMPDKDTLAALADPFNAAEMKTTVLNAVMAGFKREVKDEQEYVDLGLIELERQNHEKNG